MARDMEFFDMLNRLIQRFLADGGTLDDIASALEMQLDIIREEKVADDDPD